MPTPVARAISNWNFYKNQETADPCQLQDDHVVVIHNPSCVVTVDPGRVNFLKSGFDIGAVELRWEVWVASKWVRDMIR